jgi:hypothetical protein
VTASTGKRSHDVRERLERRRVITSGGCWLWRGSSNNGYGTIQVAGRMRYVHVLAYEFYVGPVPEKHQVDHLCKARLCYNPDHLEPVTQYENIARSGVRWAKFQRGTCQRGHDTTDPANVYVRKDNGYRMCKECQRLRRSKPWPNS